MGMLAKIFEPIVGFADIDLDDIKVIAFDTNGTLVHTSKSKQYVADEETAQLLRDLRENKEELGVDEIVIISGAPKQAREALQQAGLSDLMEQPVEDRLAFYTRIQKLGKSVLAIDDDMMLALEAQAHVNPTTQKVKDYLQSESYRHELKHS